MKQEGALILLWLLEAHAALTFRYLTVDQSLELSCSVQQNLSSLKTLYLYHRDAQSQTTLLSMAEGGELSVSPQHGWRLQVKGGLNSPQVNVTLTHLQQRDSGLYLCEQSFTEGTELLLSDPQVFVLVHREGRTCLCSSNNLPLMLTILGASGLLAAALLWLAMDKCPKTKPHRRPRPPGHTIYEVMERKQQSAVSSQNNLDTVSHLMEEIYPVYANPKITDQPQDSYYACPRSLQLKA